MMYGRNDVCLLVFNIFLLCIVYRLSQKGGVQGRATTLQWLFTPMLHERADSSGVQMLCWTFQQLPAEQLGKKIGIMRLNLVLWAVVL